jgi:hypothetical protein
MIEKQKALDSRESETSFWKKRKEDMESFEPGLDPKLLNQAINMPYSLFEYGINKGKLKLEVKSKKPEFLKHFITPSVRILIIILLLLTIAPIIVIPIICYFKSKWILLLAILALWVATIITNLTLQTSKPKKNFMEFALIWFFLTAILVYYLGAFNTFCFVAICFSYEYFFLCFSDLIHDEIVKNQLLKDENFYDESIRKDFIIIKYI